MKNENAVLSGNGLKQRPEGRFIDRYLRESAKDLFEQILVAETDRFLEHYRGVRDPLGREAVVRNGLQPRRIILT